MPKVKVTAHCIVHVSPSLTLVYSPCESTLAPDAHIDEIVARGCGERLTQRGEDLASGSASSGCANADARNSGVGESAEEDAPPPVGGAQ